MISIIIAAYNAEKIIGRCLSSLLTQNYPRNKYEIIVVDDGSTDNTKGIVKKFKKIKLIEQKHRGPAVARNLGVKHSKGKIVLFTDSDCIPGKNWIKHMVESFKDKEIVGVSGTYRTLNKDKLIARFVGYEIEDRHEKLAKENNIDFIGTFSAGYRKGVFKRTKGFDTKFSTANAEDTEFSFKLSQKGCRMIFNPKAYVYHRHPDTLRKFVKQKFWRGYWRIPLYKKYTKKIFRHSYTPKMIYIEIGLLGITTISLFLSFLRIIPSYFSFIFFLLTFLLTLPLSLKIFKKDKLVGLLSPVIIILRNFTIGLGIVYGLIFFTKRSINHQIIE